MAIKPSGSLSLSEINTEFGAGTNLNAYRGRSWFTESTSGAFSSGTISIDGFYSKRAYNPYQLVTSPQVGLWAWGYNGYPGGKFGANQTVRGAMYISRQIYGATTLLDSYGNPYAGNGLYYPGNSVANSYDTISWTNPAGYPVDVELQIYVGRSTDDYTRNVVYRGGSIANITTHSGGTLVYDTGWTTGSYFTYTETVPANTTYTWYNYSGVMSGSGGDGNTSWMNMRMLGVPGQRASSPQTNLWAWGYNGYPGGKFGANQTVRGAMYISRQIYGATTLLDSYGNPYAGNGLYYPGNSVANSYDTVSWTNPNSYSITVELEIWVGRATDDYTRNLVYRNGSIANISTHSGGTLVYDTGNTTGTLFRFTDTIPANTTHTYYNYSGVMSGSGGDGNTSWIKLRVV